MPSITGNTIKIVNHHVYVLSQKFTFDQICYVLFTYLKRCDVVLTVHYIQISSFPKICTQEHECASENRTQVRTLLHCSPLICAFIEYK